MSTRKYFRVYSAQKNRETNGANAYISHSIRADEENADQKIAEIKAKQAADNKEFKEKLAREGAPPRNPRKRFTANDVPEPPPEVIQDNIIQDQPEPINPATKWIAQPPPVLETRRTPFHLHLQGHTGNTTYVLGSSKRGKSTLMMKIYDDYYGGNDRKFISILWAQNPQIGVYKNHSKLLVGNWGSTGKEGEAVIKLQHKIQRGSGNEYKFLNIFDDILDTRNSKLINNLIMTYRNSKMSTIIAMQYCNLLSKANRTNVNNVLLFGFNADEAIEVVIKCYLQGYLKKIGIIKMPDMINWYKAMTDDHGFIYIQPEADLYSFHKIRT